MYDISSSKNSMIYFNMNITCMPLVGWVTYWKVIAYNKLLFVLEYYFSQ